MEFLSLMQTTGELTTLFALNCPSRKKILLRRRKMHEKFISFREYTALPIYSLTAIGGIAHLKPSFGRIWSKVRKTDWWFNVVLENFDNKDWIENFRMTKETFLKVCDLVRTDLKPKQNLLLPRIPLSVEKQVAIAIYKLASCGEYRVIGNTFGVHKSTVKKCFYRFVTSLLKHHKKYIHMPNKQECDEICSGFEAKSKIPQIIGAIDGTHIPILPPSDGYRDFINRKCWASYVLQAVVDDELRFVNFQ